MKKIKFLSFITSFLFSIIVFSNSLAYANNTIPYIHIGGEDRYETSRKFVYLNQHEKIKYVVFVSGNNYPDALSAAPLAKRYNAPIILLPSGKDYLEDSTKELLSNYDVQQAFIIGGTGVISDYIDRWLNSKNILTIRVAGQDRYETSLKVAERLGNPTEAFITTGQDFRDALSVSPIATNKIAPIILAPSNGTMSNALKDYFKQHNITKTYVIGGSNIISNALFNQLPNAERINGSDAFEKNANIINRFKSSLNFSETYIASEEVYADALGGSILAAETSSPIILIKDPVPSVTNNLFNANRSNIKHITVLGGEGAVSNVILNQLENLQEEYLMSDILEPYYKSNSDSGTYSYTKINDKVYVGTILSLRDYYENADTSYMDYNLDGKYTNISGKVGLDYLDSYDDSDLRFIKIYGDGKLLKEYNVQYMKDPIDFNVDVTGITKLQVEAGVEAKKLRNEWVYVVFSNVIIR